HELAAAAMIDDAVEESARGGWPGQRRQQERDHEIPTASSMCGVSALPMRRRYAATTFVTGPDSTTRPSLRQIALSQRDCTVSTSCETTTSVPPRPLKAFMNLRHFRLNSMSPTDNTSSTMRISAGAWMMVEKPR